MKAGKLTAALGVTQILAWGSTYYLPAVFAAPIAADTGWPVSGVAGGLSLGLLVAALVSPRVGRLIEREGGRRALAASAVLIGVAEIALALAPNLPAYLAAWGLMGLGMGAGLYDAGFATLGRLYGHDARRAITGLTLFGGFASTLCWPLSAFLVTHAGWRGALIVYAAIQFGFSLPVYLLAVPRAVPARQAPPAGETPLRPAPKSPALVLLLAATITQAAALATVLSTYLLPILQARGATLAQAVALGALIGPCQVAARAAEMGVARRRHPIWTKLTSAAAIALGLALLAAGAAPVGVALGVYAAGMGLESIARGTLPLALFGASGYATLMGRLATPSLIAQSLAPWAGALWLQGFGAGATLAALGVGGLVNLGLTLALWAHWRKARAPEKPS